MRERRVIIISIGHDVPSSDRIYRLSAEEGEGKSKGKKIVKEQYTYNV